MTNSFSDYVISVRLLNPNGSYVTDVEIPRFALMPEALMWGSRVFTRNKALVPSYHGGYAYTEVFCYTVPKTEDEK